MHKLAVAFAFASCSLVSAQAVADHAPLSRLDGRVVSPHCAALGSSLTFDQASDLRVLLEVRVSIASCAASEALNRVPTLAPTVAPDALTAAAAPAIAMLDEVIAHADEAPRAAIIANNAKANIYGGMVVRARAMVPSMAGATGDQLVALEQAHRAVEPELAPWVDRAEAAYSAVEVLARAHPELAPDPVVQTAVRDSHVALDASPLSAAR